VAFFQQAAANLQMGCSLLRILI